MCEKYTLQRQGRCKEVGVGMAMHRDQQTFLDRDQPRWWTRLIFNPSGHEIFQTAFCGVYVSTSFMQLGSFYNP